MCLATRLRFSLSAKEVPFFSKFPEKKTTGLTMTEVGGMGAALANEETITLFHVSELHIIEECWPWQRSALSLSAGT